MDATAVRVVGAVARLLLPVPALLGKVMLAGILILHKIQVTPVAAAVGQVLRGVMEALVKVVMVVMACSILFLVQRHTMRVAAVATYKM
jgi:hypothetical protein